MSRGVCEIGWTSGAAESNHHFRATFSFLRHTFLICMFCNTSLYNQYESNRERSSHIVLKSNQGRERKQRNTWVNLNLVPGYPSSSDLSTMKFLFAFNWTLVAYLFTCTLYTWSICYSPQMWSNLIQGGRVSPYFCQGNYPAWMVILPQSIPFFCTPSSQVAFHSSQNYRLLVVFF